MVLRCAEMTYQQFKLKYHSYSSRSIIVLTHHTFRNLCLLWKQLYFVEEMMRWNCFPELTDKRFFPCMYRYMHLQLQFYAEMCHRVQKDVHTCPYSGKDCE